jgi:hypothetical protein
MIHSRGMPQCPGVHSGSGMRSFHCTQHAEGGSAALQGRCGAAWLLLRWVHTNQASSDIPREAVDTFGSQQGHKDPTATSLTSPLANLCFITQAGGRDGWSMCSVANCPNTLLQLLVLPCQLKRHFRMPAAICFSMCCVRLCPTHALHAWHPPRNLTRSGPYQGDSLEEESLPHHPARSLHSNMGPVQPHIFQVRGTLGQGSAAQIPA